MKKNYLSLILLMCALNFGFGQVSENFDGWTDNGYGGVSTYASASGNWETNNSICDPTNARTGRAVRFNDDSGENEYLLYTGLDGNGKDNGLGDISFWYRHWNGNSSNVQFQTQYSTNGGSTWINIAGVISATSTAYSQFSSTVNLNGNDILIRVISIDDEERLMIDDFEISDFSCSDTMDWESILSPTSSPQTITEGQTFNVSTQAVEPGVTNANPTAAGSGVESWIGYSSTDDDPSIGTGWTWVSATYSYDVGANDVHIAEIGSGLAPGTYYYATRHRLNGCTFTYGGTGGPWNNDSVELIVLADQVDFCNLQSPATGTQVVGGIYNVYARAYEPGVTPAAGASPNISAWIGFNTTDATSLADFTDPSWTWVPATYQGQFGNDDEYVADIGPSIPGVGTYYYASRFQLNGSSYSYGGITPPNGGNFWDGTTYISGIVTFTNAPCSDLIISEYVEGSGNTKYLEIFNGTGGSVNLSNYDVEFYNNGSATPTNTFALSGTLLDGETIVLQDNNATLYTGTTTTMPFGVSFNGDDAIALVNNSTIIDVIGQIGFDPGTEWTGGSSSTLNRTLRRKSTIQVGDADGSNVFDPNVEWDTFPINSIDDLGFHFSSCHPDREIQLEIGGSDIACGYTYNYGNQIINTTTDVTLTIENIGDLPLQINDLTFANGTVYSVVGAPTTPFSIPASSSQDITIRFLPLNTIGLFTDTLTIDSNDTSEGLCDVNLYGISSSNCATTTTVFALQSFESLPSDTWSYTADHAPIVGNWDVTSSLTDIASAQNGSNFWGMTDLERTGHMNETHELTFTQSLAGYTNVQLSFFYYTINLDAGDSLEYEIFFDSVSQGTVDISANNDAWTEVLVNIPDSVGTLDLIFYADIDAVNDQAGLDNISLSSTIINTATWDGTNWNWNDGTLQDTFPNSSSTNVILNAAYNTSAADPLQQSFTACSLTVNNAALTIDNGDYIEVQNDLTVTGTGSINIEPDGSFVQINDNGAVTADNPDNITVSKLTAPAVNWYEYTYWSSPVENETIGDALGLSNPNRRYWFNAQNYLDEYAESGNNNATGPGNEGQDDVDDDNDDWQQITDSSTPISNSSFLEPGIGYATTLRSSDFCNPITPACPTDPSIGIRYTFSGLFNNGLIEPAIYRNDAETDDNNWNLIGNPYPSAIAVNGVNGFLTQNTTIIDGNVTGGAINGAIFIWSQSTPPSNMINGNENINFSQSDYAIINGMGSVAGGDANNDGMIDNADRPGEYIPSGQAFLVSMDDTASSTLVSGTVRTTDITFNNAMRVTGNNDLFFRNNPNSQDNKLWIDLLSDNGIANEILVGYLDNASDDYDGMYYDTPRHASSDFNAVIYTSIPDVEKRFAIQGKNSNSLSMDEIIPLGFHTNVDAPTIYSLSISQVEGAFMNDNDIFVVDMLLNLIHNLKLSDYSFTSESGVFDERFEIVFRADALSIDDTILDSNELIITELSDRDVQIKVGSNFTITKVEILDILGRKVYDLNGNDSIEIYDLSKLSNTAYIAKVTLSNGQTISKKAIKRL